MIYKIELSKQAEKFFVRLLKSNRKIGLRIAKTIDSLAENPELGIELKGELLGLRKYRVGSYRIIYQIKKSKLLISVIDIGHRKDVYR